jgi:hypothetical protein
MMEAVHTSESSVYVETTRVYIQYLLPVVYLTTLFSN